MNLDKDLSILGESPDKVALMLKGLGIRGLKGEGFDCPIARYLRLCGYKEPAVSLKEVVVTSDDGTTESITTPEAVSTFLYLFDRGCWPELESKD